MQSVASLPCWSDITGSSWTLTYSRSFSSSPGEHSHKTWNSASLENAADSKLGPQLNKVRAVIFLVYFLKAKCLCSILSFYSSFWEMGAWFSREDSCKGLTAFQLHDTGLDVHREILQVHGAGQCQSDSRKRRELNDTEPTFRETVSPS